MAEIGDVKNLGLVINRNMVNEHPRPTVATIKHLYAHAFRCAYPGCPEPLFKVDPVTSEPHLNSRMCHIHARREGGPRWQHGQSSEENRHRDNLVLMCEAHASQIDDPASVKAYPPELLREWKNAQFNEYGRAQAGWALGDAAVRKVQQAADVAPSVSISHSTIHLGGQGGMAPGAGGGGGGAIGPGARGGDGGNGGEMVTSLIDISALKSADFSGEIEIEVGKCGKGGRLPGELAGDGSDTVLRLKRHDGSILTEIRAKGGAAPGPKLPEGFRELSAHDLTGGIQVTALMPVNAAEIRDGLSYVLGGDWRWYPVPCLPADLIVNVLCSLRWRELNLSDEGIGFHLFLCHPSGERIAYQPLTMTAAQSQGGMAKFLVHIGSQIGEAGEYALQVLSGDYLLAEAVIRVVTVQDGASPE